ncbi:MAG: 1-deoxy-D-xylulose-5-phosphate synthase [Clostridiales bacterium]|nr:1-deoxy-D-xylulose-5-phosphate synthase [Clostridiales bacterium]MBR0468964.1 1-deoxy-D-xylulose-5-phosphate synthase [Mogibacterium sp.]
MKYDLYKDDLLNICRTASVPDLNVLAQEIREFMIDKVSKTGGHIASNLGIVELTIALMRVFDSPRDKIIYDVGHQSYVHKILTGRAAGFDTLRQYKGMSGFPKSRESEHDVYDTGHSSTSVSAAYGMAVARDLSGDDYQVTAVIGDGSFTNGIVYEALNNIGDHQTNINIILNDNGMSISHNVGAMHKYLNKIRVSKRYDEAKSSVKSVLNNVPVIGGALSRGLRSSKEKIKYSVLTDEAHIMESLGIKYFGPVDGYDIQDLTDIIRAASEYDGPTLIHVITTKGKGYGYAEKYPRKFHGIGPFDPATGEAIGKSGAPSFSKVFGEKITELANKDDKVVAIAAAMGTATGLLPFYEAHEDRYFDVGIAEEHAVVFAAGLAKQGYKPYVAIYSSFLQRAFDFIMQDVALQDLHVVFAVDRAGLVGADGETHHGIFDLSYMNMVPGMTVLAPADGNQLSEMLEFAKDMDGPVAIRYPRGSSEGDHLRLSRFKGSNTVISEGEDVQILAAGAMLDEALKAADLLKQKGFSAGVTNVAVVRPLDTSWADLRAKLAVTLEDNVISGGFGEAFTSAFRDHGYDILNIAIPDEFIEQGDIPSLRKECGIDAASVAEAVIARLEERDGRS